MGIYLTGGIMLYNKIMTNSESIKTDDSVAVIEGNTVRIFGRVFPLKRPYYFKSSGKLESFDIDPTIIKYNGQEIPIGGKIILYEDGKFHWAAIYQGYKYEHNGQLFNVWGGIFFYPSGNLEQFSVKEKTETNFIVEGEKLILYEADTVILHDESGLPKKIRLRYSDEHDGKEYNVLEVSETGDVINRILERRPNHDPD
jgi:hypothetical protein